MENPVSILNLADLESKELIAGTKVRFVHTENMTLAYWRFEAGASLPEHSHPHEQVTNVIEGVFDLTVEGETKRLEAGAVAVIAPNIRHSGKPVSECQIIDVFFPVRDEYR